MKYMLHVFIASCADALQILQKCYFKHMFTIIMILCTGSIHCLLCESVCFICQILGISRPSIAVVRCFKRLFKAERSKRLIVQPMYTISEVLTKS